MTLKTKSFIFNTSTTICTITFTIFLTIVSIVKGLQHSPYIMLIIISGIVLATSIILQLFYKKALSTEIIFLTIFLVSIAMQNIRIAIPLFESNSYIITLIITRISILFKYLGLLSLLGASLFSYSIKQQKIGSWLLLSTLTSITIATIIHFNTGIIEKNLLPKIIFGNEELVIALAIITITTLSFIKTGFDTKNKEYIFLGISTTVLSLGLILMFRAITIFSGVVISLMLIVGFISFLKSVHNITLWG